MQIKTGAVIVAAGIAAGEKDWKTQNEKEDITTAQRIVLNFKRAGVKDIVIVTGFQAKYLEKNLKHYGVTFLHNESYETTQMFDSARMGLKFLKDKCDKICFCPVDVPFFSSDTVEQIIKADGKVVIPTCKGHVGHPICFDSDLIHSILEYQGEGGLRGALAYLEMPPVYLNIQDEGAIIDTEEQKDYQHLVELHDASLMRPEIKVRLASKQPFFGPGTVRLLKLINALGSVKDACDKAGISYSKGWTIIRTCEKELGYSVVERQPGGKNGGAAAVSEKGLRLLALFEEY